MTVGALILAQNNSSVDYIKLSVFSAERVKKFLDIPVTLVTDNRDWLESQYPSHPFDTVVDIAQDTVVGTKDFYDGTLASRKLEWKNRSRHQVYDLTPYDKTLVIDSDYVINSKILKIALEKDEDFQIYQKSFDLAGWRDTRQFERINSYSIPFYWATAFVFKKNTVTQAFFDLVSYIKDNWYYFRMLYNIEVGMFRNDFAFSIAIHIMNGKTNGRFAVELPGTMTYCTDKDLLIKIVDDKMQLLVEKKDYVGEYQAIKTEGLDVHVMNKLSLTRFINGGSGV